MSFFSNQTTQSSTFQTMQSSSTSSVQQTRMHSSNTVLTCSSSTNGTQMEKASSSAAFTNNPFGSSSAFPTSSTVSEKTVTRSPLPDVARVKAISTASQRSFSCDMPDDVFLPDSFSEGMVRSPAVSDITHPDIVQNRSYTSSASSSDKSLGILTSREVQSVCSSEFFQATSSVAAMNQMRSSGTETTTSSSSIREARSPLVAEIRSSLTPEAAEMYEKRRPKRIVGRSISLNFNTAHALSLRLRRGHGLISPLKIRDAGHEFRNKFTLH